ncbi:thioester-forming surface-anchored protein [Corynebacterium diphtheriae]|nr:thioester-forming surface-anchored protein [Corynebacterium diphtheriae]CAB0737037.1 thioester-forming surface-anchored protein [Corynebacterium diphtheriae]CAB0860240.1 thioester-forming surface-anchored protein [Corynebacterium diphtheriae]CAB0890863.1 thioester-forming surface-anchored protein [Corynebacterium diphtheriae]CAB0932914.1 thioester-forming surface-anchored protein [Corynebacterium diphtheriae]
MVKSVRLICILVVSLLLGASFVAPHSYAADGDHSTNADTVEIWVKETPKFDFKNKNYNKEKEDKEKQGESTRKIYVEDPVAPGKKFVGYCFDLNKGFPGGKGQGSDKFSKTVATENLFSDQIKGRTPRLQGSDLNKAILKIIWNGYGETPSDAMETPSDAMIDRAKIAKEHNLTPDQFHNITQHAIWYYTDKAPIELKESPKNVQKALLVLLGIETDPSVTLIDPPADMTLNFYLTSSPDSKQNVLGALPVDKKTMEPLPESGNPSSTPTPSEDPAPPTSSTDTTKPSETTSTEATSTKETSTESTTTEPTTTSTPAEPYNPQSSELGSSVGTYAIIGLPIAIGTIALIKAFTSTPSSSPQHTNPPVGSTAAAATPAKTTEAPPTQHAPQAKRQLAKTGASVLMVMAIALALVVAGLLLVRRRP